MEKSLRILKYIEKYGKILKDTEMYCIFADQAIQDYETCSQQEKLLRNIEKYGKVWKKMKNTEMY